MNDGRDEFMGWVQPHWEVMARVAKRFAPPSESDDVLQEALLAAWRYRHTFDQQKGTARAWLLKITAREAQRLVGAAGNRTQFATGLPSTAQPAAVKTHDELDQAIDELDARLRDVVWLHYYCDLSVKATADELDRPVGTVKAQLSEARRSLLTKLSAPVARLSTPVIETKEIR